MTSIILDIEKRSGYTKIMRECQLEIFCETLSKYGARQLPWKYIFYHTFNDVLNVYQPELAMHPRAKIFSSLTSGVFNRDRNFNISDDYIIK